MSEQEVRAVQEVMEQGLVDPDRQAGQAQAEVVQAAQGPAEREAQVQEQQEGLAAVVVERAQEWVQQHREAAVLEVPRCCNPPRWPR